MSALLAFAALAATLAAAVADMRRLPDWAVAAGAAAPRFVVDHAACRMLLVWPGP